MTSYQCFYGRFFRVIYGRLETALIWISETHCVFLEPYIGVWKRLQAYIVISKWLHINFFHGRFFRVIYGRLETAPIWISETHMRFLEPYIGVWKRPKAYIVISKWLHISFFMGVSLESYMVVWKRLIYGIVKRTCVFLEPYIGVWERLQAYIVLSKWLHISVFYGRFFRVIYGRLETAYIWLSETHMRFFRAIYRRLETTLYQCFQTLV